MKTDKRRYNDNSRNWNNEMQKKREEALIEICKIISLKNEPETFAHVSKLMHQKYDKHIAISAQTISQNINYRNIYDSIFVNNSNEEEQNRKRKHISKSVVEIKHELHTEKIKNTKLNREISILRHQIKQSNIKSIQNEYEISDESLTKIYMDTVNTLLTELLHFGDFFIDKDGIKRERDNALILSNKIINLLGINQNTKKLKKI
ncbi:hypothetical protein ACOTVM_01630 [Aliarcobacter butzleri]